jgi:hypothetical protein
MAERGTPGYGNRSRRRCRLVTANPALPIASRYTTSTTALTPTAPNDNRRNRSTPRYSGVNRTNTWRAGEYVDRGCVVGGQDERLVLLLQAVQAFPQDMAGLGIETRGGLVEQPQDGVRVEPRYVQK